MTKTLYEREESLTKRTFEPLESEKTAGPNIWVKHARPAPNAARGEKRSIRKREKRGRCERKKEKCAGST